MAGKDGLHQRSWSGWRGFVAAAGLAAAALALAACSGAGSSAPVRSGSPGAAGRPGPAATTATTAGGTTTTAGVGALSVTVDGYMTARGLRAGTWTVTDLRISPVDPSYALFRIGSTSRNAGAFQGGYGFAYQHDGTWAVIAFGPSAVGCPAPGSTAPAVPAAVLAGFGVACPPGGTAP